MRIERVGEIWAAAYELDALEADEEGPITREVVAEKAGGADGVFDFYGDDPFPLAPRTITCRFTLRSATYAGIDTKLDELKLATIGAGRVKVWSAARDGAQRRWAYAKCIGLNAPEVHGRNYTTLPITLTFYLSEGVWYSDEKVLEDRITLDDYVQFTVNNLGNRPLFPKITVAMGDGSTSTMKSVTFLNLTNSYEWIFEPAVLYSVTVDPSSYSCTYIASPGGPTLSGYAYLAYQQLVRQTAWMRLEPGENTINISCVSNEILVGTVATYSLTLADVYL